MAEPSSRLPEEDRPRIRPGELDARERAGSSPRRRGDHSGPGSTPGRRTRGGQTTGGGGSSAARRRGDHGDGSWYNPGDSNESDDDPEQGLYNEDGDKTGIFSRLRGGGGKKRSFLGSKRNKIIVVALSALVSLVIAMGAFFFAGIFNLPNFMKNVEQAGFQRYQVDLNGRSSEWLRAYMELRFSEVYDQNVSVGQRDNVLFRSNRVDTNRPLRDWYRTLRTSKFEDDVFARRGIKFTSIAYQDGNITKFRPGRITFPNGEVDLDPKTLGYDQLDALSDADINKLNDVIGDRFEKFDSDKQARKAIKELLREEQPQWWKAAKRYHLRKDIQNEIGVRKWKFFEEKRNALHEKKISIRNKLVTQALPEDSKSGTFLKCLFGVPDCSASNDPANTAGDDHSPTGSNKSGDKTDGDPDNPKPVGDGSGESTLKGGADTAAAAGDVAGKIISKLLAKAGVLSLLDSLARFNESIQNHTLSKLVAQANAQQVMGLFTVFSVASDQLTTGQVSNAEVRQFMDKFARPTNSEGWSTVIEGKGSGSVSAASTGFTEAKNKQQFCSPKHQALMEKYPAEADKEYQWQCPEDKINSANRAQNLEDAWNSGPGAVLGPILDLYHKATGGVFDVFNTVASAITDPIVSGVLSVTHTEDDVKQAVAYVGAQALKFGGATSKVNENTPSGEVGNLLIEGGAVTGEASMRDNGGAKTTAVTRALAEKNVIAYNHDQAAHSSLFSRYLSTSNPKSFVSTQLFAINDLRYGSFSQYVSSIFASAFTAPFRMLTQPTHAEVSDSYAAANFAGIDTYDMPQCPKAMDETPQNVTNADELGYFKPGELTWDLVTDKSKWYPALYDKVNNDEDKAEQVWNCALLDNVARGGIGARYGAKGEDAFSNESDPTGGADNTTPPSTVSGNAQQIAQDILSNSNITYQFSAKDDVQLAAQGKNGTNGAPIDIRLLQIVAALGKKHKVDVSAYESYGQGHSAGSDHYSGHAVDIANIDGVVAYKNITDFWDEISQYSNGAVFLQGDCPGAKSAPKGMDREPGDTCNHQHISVGPAN